MTPQLTISHEATPPTSGKRGVRVVRSLASIGYEGADLGQFIRALTKARIRTLVDVRDLPLSRKKGFSKTPLAKHLEQAGIRYLHLRALGDPKPGRLAARGGDIAGFKRIYATHLRSRPAQAALRKLGEIAMQAKTCLLCFERDPENCHRRIVAARLATEFGLKVEHLQAPLTSGQAL
ncbi:MAG: DUF488 domain-containing protein [Alphaproteobacteria bacterium]|nr:DUF488 domain-containing protein [Alphaproteobacteria bacterium]